MWLAKQLGAMGVLAQVGTVVGKASKSGSPWDKNYICEPMRQHLGFTNQWGSAQHRQAPIDRSFDRENSDARFQIALIYAYIPRGGAPQIWRCGSRRGLGANVFSRTHVGLVFQLPSTTPERDRRIGTGIGLRVGSACPPTVIILLLFGASGVSMDGGETAAGAAFGLPLASTTRPLQRGRNRFLQHGSSESSSEEGNSAARCRLGGRSARGKSAASRSMKGMCLPFGKQLWNCANAGRSAAIMGGCFHSRTCNK